MAGPAVCHLCKPLAVYLLSNNHINGLIATPFDSDEEELLAYYISFLKTLSLSLNEMTVQFFFNKVLGCALPASWYDLRRACACASVCACACHAHACVCAPTRASSPTSSRCTARPSNFSNTQSPWCARPCAP